MKELELGKKILVITAHPDDESYLFANLLMQNREQGGKNFLVCATLGEKGTPKLKHIVSAKQLEQVRKRELTKVSKFLKINKLVLLGLPDGSVREHLNNFHKACKKMARKVKPDMVVSFGREGISGHRDHTGTAVVARKIAMEFRLPLLCATMPPKLIDKAYHWIKKRRIAPHYHHKEIKHPQPNVMLKVNKGIKLKALSFHLSQVDPKYPFHGYPKAAAKEFLKADYFVLKKP